MVSVMIVAGSVHWNNGLFATANGIEIVLLYAVAGVTLALTGPGAWSIDGLLELAWPVWLNLTVLAIGVAGGVVNLLARRPTPAAQQIKQAA
jgi:putative oxidoreductase